MPAMLVFLISKAVASGNGDVVKQTCCNGRGDSGGEVWGGEVSALAVTVDDAMAAKAVVVRVRGGSCSGFLRRFLQRLYPTL